MRGKSGYSERSRDELIGKLGMQRLRDGWLDLILNSDVQARVGLILGNQKALKIRSQFVADSEQFRAVDTVGDAPAQRHHLAQPSDGRRTLGRQRGQPRFDLGQMAGWQVVKQSDVSIEIIALGREVSAS